MTVLWNLQLVFGALTCSRFGCEDSVAEAVYHQGEWYYALECMKKFCYPGDVIGLAGSIEVLKRRVKCAWVSLGNSLWFIITARRVSLKLKGKVYTGLKPRVYWGMAVRCGQRLKLKSYTNLFCTPLSGQPRHLLRDDRSES